MSKKKEHSKNLQKRLSAIVEIYVEQKGKQKKNTMKQFIEQKMDEIIIFNDTLNKRKRKSKHAAEPNEQQVASTVPELRPSVELINNLQNTSIGGQAQTDATNNS